MHGQVRHKRVGLGTDEWDCELSRVEHGRVRNGGLGQSTVEYGRVGCGKSSILGRAGIDSGAGGIGD